MMRSDAIWHQTSWSLLVQVMAPIHFISYCWIFVKWTLGNKLNEILFEIHQFLCEKMHLKMLSAKWCPFCSGLIMLTLYVLNFFRGNINIYLHSMSFLHIDMTQVVEILPQIRQGPTYSTQSISWLLMSWRRKEPGHQQPWYWPS